MQHAALAQRFEDVSRSLRTDGHGIIIRKARALIEGGDLDGAMAFIERAGARMRSEDLDGLLAAVRTWAEGGGDVAALTADPGWDASRAREDQASKLIGEAVASGGNLSELIDALALEQMALAENEPLASLPPMPERVEVAEPAVEPEVPAAVVEKPAELEAREPDFDGPAIAEPEAPTEPEVVAEPPEPEVAEPAEPEVAEPEAAEPEAPTEPEVVAEPPEPAEPEVAEPETPVVTADTPVAPTEQGGGATGLIVTLLIVAAAVAAYFLFK